MAPTCRSHGPAILLRLHVRSMARQAFLPSPLRPQGATRATVLSAMDGGTFSFSSYARLPIPATTISLSLKPDIEESHEWKDSHEWKPNPYVRRRPKQGILFLPKPTTSPAPSYFTPKIAGGKRCADDFDCMHVLGQVCKRRRRGNTGNCECPDSTPVKLEDEAQPRCVAGAPR
ncbi:uncharacterized protein LOC144173162 isoform X1 [Haemaphysalis longicornis]